MSIKKIEDPELEAMDYDMDMKDDYESGKNKCCHEEDQYYQVRVSRCKEECPKPKPCPPEPCYKPCYVPCYEKYPEPCYKPCHEKDECHKERKCSRVLLTSATGGAGPLPAITVAAPLTAPIPVVSLTIDPDKICDPNILLNFTSIISIPAAAVLSLAFQVYRTIDNGTPIAIGPQFTFARTIAALETDSFGFQLFDKNVDGRTVTYSVVLATTSLISVAVGVTILNATLSAIGVD